MKSKEVLRLIRISRPTLHRYKEQGILEASKVANVIVSYKDKLSRIGFNLFYYLFQKFGKNIIVISEVGNEKLDSQEIFEEIVSILHCYSMKLYSKRKNKIIDDLIREDEIN